jgi:hypothetical protein
MSVTSNTPMSGKDTASHFKGLIIGAALIAAAVLVTVYLTNKKFEGHETTAAETTH